MSIRLPYFTCLGSFLWSYRDSGSLNTPDSRRSSGPARSSAMFTPLMCQGFLIVRCAYLNTDILKDEGAYFEQTDLKIQDKVTLEVLKMEPNNFGNPFKIVVVGDAGVGKSSYIKKQFSPDFNRDYLQTVGYEMSRWTRNMTTGCVDIDLWDISGSQSTVSDRQIWLKNSDAAIIMVDLAQSVTFENALRWHRELLAANPAGIPVVVSTWKPIPNDKLLDIDPETLFWLGETENVQFYDLASDVSRFDQPMLHIIRSLAKDPTTNFWFPYTMTDEDSVISD